MAEAVDHDTRAEQLPSALEALNAWAEGIGLNYFGLRRRDAIHGALVALDNLIALQLLAEAGEGGDGRMLG